MSRNDVRQRLLVRVWMRASVSVLLGGVVVLPLPAAAQTPSPRATTPAVAVPQSVEVDPVQCWWRTSTPAVIVGESFTLHLTCSALESENATATVDKSRLAPAAVQFPPFEVTGGRESEDYVTTGRRFSQFHYDLRLVAEDFFGLDLAIPALAVSYRIESRVRPDAAVQGREQTYEMPALSMRINTLVSQAAQHIRESPVPTLDEIAARHFRARLFRLSAWFLFAIAGLLLLIALVRWLRAARGREVSVSRDLLPHRTVLAAARRRLRETEREVRGGWSTETVTSALAGARVVASYLTAQPVAQRAAAVVVPGEVQAFARPFGRRPVVVSGAATAHALSRLPAATAMHDALATMTAARYGNAERLDDESLSAALTTAIRYGDRMGRRHSWLAETGRQVARALRLPGARAWAR